jgi:hypothetical protein
MTTQDPILLNLYYTHPACGKEVIARYAKVKAADYLSMHMATFGVQVDLKNIPI